MGASGFLGHSSTSISPNSTAYASGDLIGRKLVLPGLVAYGGGRSLISSMALSDLDKQNVAIDVLFFESDPTGTTFTDNAALDVADADMPKICGLFSITASDYANFNDNSLATVKPAIGLNTNGTSVVYAALISRGAPTFTTAKALNLKVHALG
jgi:hypothetical protein